MQRMLREAVNIGCRTAVMECSSQAMDFHRCDSLDYAVAVFSNLTRDHLDYHETMKNTGTRSSACSTGGWDRGHRLQPSIWMIPTALSWLIG